jgi:hypothetical protein
MNTFHPLYLMSITSPQCDRRRYEASAPPRFSRYHGIHSRHLAMTHEAESLSSDLARVGARHVDPR